MNNPQNKPQKNTHLIVLTAVSAFVALLLFLDPWLSIFPRSMDLPGFGGKDPAGEEGAVGGEETKKSWWDKIFDNDRREPLETDAPDTPDEEEETTFFVDTDLPSVDWDDLQGEFSHFTEEELKVLFQNTLEYVLVHLAEKEAAGEIPPIDRVGLFDLNQNGVPEVITMGVYDGSVEYTAYNLHSISSRYPMKVVSSWSWEGTQYGELSLWVAPLDSTSSSSVLATLSHSWKAVMTHTGDGDDEYLYEFNSSMVCEERYARVRIKPFSNSSVTMEFFSLYGQKVDEKAYTESYERFMRMNRNLPETTMVTVQWNASDPEGVVEKLLTSEQFLFDGK